MPLLTIHDGNYHIFSGPRCPWPQGRHLRTTPGWLGHRPPVPLESPPLKAADVIDIIPEKEWPELIRAGAGTFLHDLTKDLLNAKDQGRTLFCWFNGVTRAAEILHGYQQNKGIELSAAAGACQVTNFRNVGGYAEDALDWIRDHGLPTVDEWPNDAIDRRYDTPELWERAKDHCILRWVEVKGWNEQISMLLHRNPIATAHNWWQHLVCQLQPVLLDDGTIAVGFDNSWGKTFGDNGYALMTKSRGTADGIALAPISETISNN
jgi:hypothetical protein